MSLTPTKFDWPAGPESVQVSGDWDEWKEKVSLDKQVDGSFAKEISLPENKRVHYKFIVDSNWTTKQGAPTVDDAGNVNNIIDVGPAPAAKASASSENAASTTTTTSTAAKTTGIAAGAAGAVGGAAALGAHGHADKQSPPPPIATTTNAAAFEKKAEPAFPVKEVADEDIRNAIPHSVTSATKGIVPVVASAVATVTGADILRGNAEALPVSKAEEQHVQANAAQQGKPTTSGGAAVTDASKAPTENAKAGANSSTSAAVANKLAAPVVPVNEAGFASNVDPARNAAAKDGGVAAGAVASAGHSTSTGSAPAAVAAPAVSAPLATTTTTTTNGQEKTLPNAPSNKKDAPVNGSTGTTPSAASAAAAPAVVAATPTTPSKPTSGTVRDKTRTPQRHGAEASTATSGTENESHHGKRKGFFGKIKSALSPHSSPSK